MKRITYKELCDMLPSTTGLKIPTVKALRTSGQILMTEDVSDASIEIYTNGFYIYSGGGYSTVQGVDRCLGVRYPFSTGEVETIDDEVLFNADYTLPLLLSGEQRLYHNANKWESIHLFSYDNTSYAESTDLADVDFVETCLEQQEKLEERNRLHDAIDQLTEKQRGVVNKTFFEGKTQQMIGEEMKITQQAVAMLLKKGIGNLKKILGK